MKTTKICVLTIIISILLSGTAMAALKEMCTFCHKRETPGIVEQFLSGKMGQSDKVGCSSCHGTDHMQGAVDAHKAKMPTPETCKECHEKRVEQYKNGKHSLAWIAMKAMPMLQHQPPTVVGDGYKGCSNCHKIGLKGEDELKEYRYGNTACDSCHTRHTFSVKEARDPRACQTCHMGFDHPQWEMWSTSKHGTIWQIEGNDSKRAAVCQTCHMPDGDHAVMTSWGFLAVRLPEEDKDWLKNRVVILQGLGVLDDEGNPTARLEVVKAGKVARLNKEEFDAARNKMINVCKKCHSRKYVKLQLDNADKVIKEADELMAEAINIVKELYKKDLLKTPEGWNTAPDILQFYEAKSSIEQELYVMFMEYRMRAIQGAFHINPDYMHWYGWAAMKESLQKIKDEAARMKAE